MANSTCCKYTVGTQNREYIAERWTLSTTFPTTDFGGHVITAPKAVAGENGKTIRELTDELTEANDKKNLCSLYYTINWALKNLPTYKNNNIARAILEEIDEHCEKCPKKDYKCKCIKKLTQEVYDTKSVGCEDGFTWNDKKCDCKEDKKEPIVKKDDEEGEAATDEGLKGCMLDKPYVTNYDPMATINSGCIFKKVITLENEFCFCTRDTCDEAKQCLKGKQEITGQSVKNTRQAFDDKYQRIYNRALEVIIELNPRTRISGEKGFYAENIESGYKEDLANALAILHFRGYSLIRAAKGEQEDQSDLVMYNTEGDYLGFFRGANYTEPLFNNLNFNLTAPVVRLRVSKNNGGIISSDWIKIFREKVNIPGTTHYMPGIKITDDGRIILPESKTPVGLASLLVKKVDGLGQLLH